MTKAISIAAYRALWEGTDEFALIDPREQADFGSAHLFAATNMPLSRLELMIDAALPHRATPIVLCDEADGTAERAAAVLQARGHTDVSILDGGLLAWQASGGAAFSGLNVPSKAFGEAVEHALETPSITSADLGAKIASGEDFLFLDSRPIEEHINHCIPGSICCPSAEMILRAADLDAYRDKDVIVHCAGRTRAIIGAQTLIDSKLFRSVRSLWNGTPAWGFEGLALAHGDAREAERPEQPSAAALASASRIAEAWSIPRLTAADLAAWRAGPGTRYLIDVRSVPEFEAGHLAGARPVPGGQLLQTTDAHLVVQNAHVVLVDSDGVRAVTTAMWLRRLGWQNVATYAMSEDDPMTAGTERPLTPDPMHVIPVADAMREITRGAATVCDLRPCHRYARGHAANAAYLTRARLARDAEALTRGITVILVADDLAYADLVRSDLTALGYDTAVLDGGMQAWQAAGGPVETGFNRLLSRPDDTYMQASHFDDPAIREREHRAYLSWEIALLDHIAGEPSVRFNLG